MVLLVTYDLNQEKNYPNLYKAIQELGEVNKDKDLDSVWFVSTKYTLNACYEHLRKAIDRNDRLFVTVLKRGEYEAWINQTTWDWIRSRT